MKALHFSIFLLAIIFASCTRDNTDNSVVIHSVPTDTIFKEIYLYGTDGSKQTFKAGETYQFSADSVNVYSVVSYTDRNSVYTNIFTTPGDSVTCKTIATEENDENVYEFSFEGKNAAQYNYATQKRKFLSQENEPNYFSNPDMDLLEYKQQIQAYRDKENEFLKNYKKKYSLSEDFIKYASAEINNQYALKLYQAVYPNKCKIIPKGYLDDADITQNLLSSYAILALQYKYIYCSPDENMERIYNAILNEVHSKYQSNILSTLLRYFAQKGDISYEKSLLQVMSQIEKTSTDSTLLAVVQEYRPLYLLSGTVLPDSILDKTYLRPYQKNQKITLRQLFDKYKNTAVYFDFWASWCGPCRHVNRTSAEGKSYLADKQIAVVYISGDKNINDWLQAVKEDGITENQYLLCSENENSFFNSAPLSRHLKINSIPRFVLFNKKHKIGILNAPHPTTDCMFEYLKKTIESNPEKYISEKLATKTDTAKNGTQNFKDHTNDTKLIDKKTVFKDCEDSTKFSIKTIYHDNFGTFSSATNYTDAWGMPRTPVKNWQTTYSPYSIPAHKTTFGWCDDGYYIISALKSPVLPYYMKGGMTKDASGDSNGAVLAINVTKNYKGEIYRHQIDNLPPNVILYFEVSIANASYVDNSTPPQVEIRIEKPNGELLGNAHSNLTSATFGWQKVKIDVPPTAEKSVILRVVSTGENWGDGCDLLMDDIIFRICKRKI